MSGTIPLVMTAAGPVPTAPAELQSALIAGVAATNPDYTANLPGSLIEDISSTDVGAMTAMDLARVDAVNAVTPYGANAYVLAQLGAQTGIAQGQPTNGNVYATFGGPSGGAGTPGLRIPAGFIVSDGTYQYVVQDGGTYATGGYTSPLYAVASQSGTWAIPVGSVTTIVSSPPDGYTITVTNAAAGVPGGPAESVQSYRSRVLQAGVVASRGTQAFILSALQAVPGVTVRLTNVLAVSGGWEVICGGGDPYQIGGAILQSTLDLSTIVGSATTARNITVSLIDGANSYSVVFVNPPQQVVTVVTTWNTTLPNFTAAAQVNQLGAPAIQNYINSITVGQPINELEMTAVFQAAVATILPTLNLTTLTFVVTINGTTTPVNAGTSIIPGDPESYFYCSASGSTVVQG